MAREITEFDKKAGKVALVTLFAGAAFVIGAQFAELDNEIKAEANLGRSGCLSDCAEGQVWSVYAYMDDRRFDITNIENSEQLLEDYRNASAKGESPQYSVVFKDSVWEQIIGQSWPQPVHQAIEFERLPE